MPTWVRDFGMEQWGLLLSLLIGAVTLLYARHASKVAVRALRASEEQLEIARTQDEMRPDLRVEVCLVDQEESDAMDGAVDPRWITALRNLREVRLLSAVSAVVRQRRLHDADTEHKVVVVEIANHGTAATRLVKGWVYLEASRLEPLKPTGGPTVTLRDGVYSVALLDKEETLPPGLSFSSRVIVAVLPGQLGTTEIGYAFSSASSEGQGPKGRRKVPV